MPEHDRTGIMAPARMKRPVYLLALVLSWVLIYFLSVSLRLHLEGRDVGEVEYKASVKPVFNATIYKKRLVHANEHCKQGNVGAVDNVYIHDGSGLAYCPVAKIGSTFWKRVFLFLHNDTGGHKVMTPFQIPRHFVHYGKKLRTQILKMNATTRPVILGDYKRFMFVRDPYARLWSAYLDKFYLPDFWRSYALIITKRRIDVSEKAKRCGSDVSFEEFLGYVTSLPPKYMNEHWQPIKYRCDPCQFHPGIIGKQETFGVDSEYVLQGIGEEWIMKTFDYDSHVEEEIKMLVDYNFNLITKNKFFAKCTDSADIAKRLWKVFQINGYLPFDETAESALMELTTLHIDKDILKDFILNKYRKYPTKIRKSWKENRLSSIRKAYKTISKPLLKKLKAVFQTDFETFGYEIQPPGH